MNPETIAALARLNTRFYDRFAESFSATRQAPWPGWERVLETWRGMRAASAAARAPSILDLGCGNGRFAAWLGEVLDPPYEYTGVDASRRLIEILRSSLAAREGVRRELVAADLVVEDPSQHLGDRRFDLVTLFGLLHHVPSSEGRRALLEGMSERLMADGLLAVTFWQFAARERFRRRFVDWEDYNREAEEPIDTAELEEGDYLLRWGEASGEHTKDVAGGCRYCHFAAPEEAAELVRSLDIEVLDTFRADGESGHLNLYYLLRKRS